MTRMATQHSPSRVSVRTPAPPLVGREADLAALAAVLLHGPALVQVEGEPGMGKTRLLTELLRRPELDGLVVLRGTCLPLREPFPYGPVLDALRGTGGLAPGALDPVTGALRPLLPELTALLPPAPEPPAGPAARRHREFRALRALLAAHGRALLVLDDLHLADEDTLELLRWLLADLPEELGVVVAYQRSAHAPLGEGHQPPEEVHVAHLALAPLDPAGVGALARGTGASPSAAFTDRLHRRTGGVPGLVRELLHHLDEPSVPALDRLAAPAALRATVTGWLAGLPEPAAAVAAAVAVLDGVTTTAPDPASTDAALTDTVFTDTTAIGALTGLDGTRLRTAIAAAAAGPVLRAAGEGRYGYHHPLAATAVCQTLTPETRKALHTKAIELLSGIDPAPLTRLAEHAGAAGLPAERRRYAEAAADRALHTGERGDAATTLLAVLDELPARSPDLPRLAVKLARLAAREFHPEVVPVLHRVLADPGLGQAERGAVLLHLGLLLTRTTGQLGRGRLTLQRAVDELSEAPELAGYALALLGRPEAGLTPLSWHEHWRTRAEQLLGSGATDATGAAAAELVLSRVQAGEPAAPAEAQRLLATDLPGTEQAALRAELAELGCHAGRTEQATGLAAEALRSARTAGPGYATGRATAVRLRLDWLTGRWDGLAQRCRREAQRQPELAVLQAESAFVRGALAAVRGETERAEELLGRAGPLHPEQAVLPVALAAYATLTGLRLAAGDLTGACEAAENGMNLLRRKEMWHCGGELVPMVAEAYAHAGRWDVADAVVEEFARAVADRTDLPLAEAALRTGRATLLRARGKHQAAAAAFDLARNQYRELGMPYPAALAWERAVRCRLAEAATEPVIPAQGGEPADPADFGDLTDLSDLTAATEELAAVGEEYERLGAVRDAARCRSALREHGPRLPAGRGRRGYGRELSPREREVAALLADGRTNREIAEALFLSPRTVEQHVAKVLRKLGAHSRTEIGRAGQAHAIG